MTLLARINHHRGDLRLDVDLYVKDEVVAILGPNGAGKSSLLRLLAGLEPIESGRIELDGHVLDDPTDGVFVPPERRPVGVVFQDYQLFPFLSARDNVAFGLRAQHISRAAARRRADEWLARVGLTEFAALRPGALSGGQAQRVALVRALATEPDLLLLDEPLAALDVTAKGDIRRELRTHLASIPGTRLVVTHDPVEAASLANRVLILENGSITQSGTMAEIALHPKSKYIAELVGINFFRGMARDGIVTLESGVAIVIPEHATDGEVCIAVHPRSVTLLLGEPAGSARNHWKGRVTDLENLGERIRVRLATPVPLVAEITAASASELGIVVGKEVLATLKATEIDVYRD